MTDRQLLHAICNLVETDFVCDMDCHNMPHSKPYTQEEAAKMSNILGRVYMYAHRIHCTACAARDLEEETKS
jgi:hypothetical protein